LTTLHLEKRATKWIIYAQLLLTLSLSDCAGTASRPDWQAPIGGPLLPFADSVREQHNQRIARLQRLSASATAAQPKFYEYLVTQNDVPGLPGDTPVLRVVFEERVFFDTALWNIRSDANAVLELVAEVLRKEPTPVTLFVAGHTDSRGSIEYNKDLSVKRANSVAEALVKRGVGLAKIWAVGFGKAVPLRDNDTAENMAINRRVEFILSNRMEAASMVLSKQGESNCSGETATSTAICKEPPIQQRFTASAVRPHGTSGTKNVDHDPPDKKVSTSEVPQVEIVLAPPTKQVGAPSR
jgi:outer membrane protein OmpA-like peptidoglycan-associated protein